MQPICILKNYLQNLSALDRSGETKMTCYKAGTRYPSGILFMKTFWLFMLTKKVIHRMIFFIAASGYYVYKILKC
jgi:hypothetical protein